MQVNVNGVCTTGARHTVFRDQPEAARDAVLQFIRTHTAAGVAEQHRGLGHVDRDDPEGPHQSMVAT